MADCGDLITRHGLDIGATRQAVQAMLDEQPLPLRGAARVEANRAPAELKVVE
jgi:hypothetical protein